MLEIVMQTNPRRWIESQEAAAETAADPEKEGVVVPSQAESGAEGLNPLLWMVTYGQMSDRQISDRARDHLYN
jgi:hypothetical protein